VGAGLVALIVLSQPRENEDLEKVMINQRAMLTIAAVGFGLLTAACGERPVDRALTGGAIGAASGAVVGSTVGNPVAGAVVGGAAGATIGAVTAPER
jgi:osmotically inducible lipoprotein OsmB